jgi:hypothetical protein
MRFRLKQTVKALNDHGKSLPGYISAKYLADKIKIERPYKTPKNYLKWDILAGILGLSIDYFFHPDSDVPSKLHGLRCALWLSKDAPVYALNHHLLNEFMFSDMSNRKQLLANFEPVHETFLLLFPQGQVKTPDESHIDWIVVHFSDLDKPEKSSVNFSDSSFSPGLPAQVLSHDDCKNFHVSGISDNNYTWYIGAGVDEDGNILESRKSYSEQSISEAEHKFLVNLRDIALQCMLALLFAPELIEKETEEKESDVLNQSKYKSKSKVKNRFRSVRWIGNKTYKKAYQGRHNKSGKHRKSPRGHLRRGHWHLFPCGKGRKDRVCKYVKETFVLEGKRE